MITVTEFLKIPTHKQEMESLWKGEFEQVLDEKLKEGAKNELTKIHVDYSPTWTLGEYFLKNMYEASFVKDVLVPVVTSYRSGGWKVWFMEEDRYKESIMTGKFNDVGKKTYSFKFTMEVA